MKTKILLTSALALTIACPAMSETLPAITSCTEPQIGTSTSPASLEADWSANTITLTWENNGATTDATGGASTCTYDQSFDLPTPPEKTGYNFAGWKVKTIPIQAKCPEIEDPTQCDSTPECEYSVGECKYVVDSCSSITNIDKCYQSVTSSSRNHYCSWSSVQGGRCRAGSSPSSGGSN